MATALLVYQFSVAVVAHAYQADYVSGELGGGATGSGGLYISDGDNYCSASADTSISGAGSNYRTLSVFVYIDPWNPNAENWDSDDSSVGDTVTVQVNAGPATVTVGGSAGASHSTYMVDNSGNSYSWGDGTEWSR